MFSKVGLENLKQVRLVYGFWIQMKRVDGKDVCLKSFASWPNRAQSSPHKPRNAP